MNNETSKVSFNDKAIVAPFNFIHLYEIEGDKVEIKLTNATVETSLENRSLIENATLLMKQGYRVGLTGPNGSGKSSLLRAIGGLDSAGNGSIEVTLPKGKKSFCASQEIRKTPTTLPGLMAYPSEENEYTHEEYEQALMDADLERIIEHLPWNAVQTERILKIAQPYIDAIFRKMEGKVSLSCAEDFAKKFRTVFHKHFDMPDSLQDHYDDDIHERVVDAITAQVAKKLEKDPSKEEILVLFTNRAAKKAAKALAEVTREKTDGWLLQGQRMTLSGGEQQRMIFARAFLQEKSNALFIFDEPTSALKSDTAHGLVTQFIGRNPDATMLAIIHDESLLKHLTHHLELHPDKTMTITPITPEYLKARLDASTTKAQTKPPAP